MRDFFEILNKEGVYNPELHNKSEGTYQLWGNLVEFISVDQPQKVQRTEAGDTLHQRSQRTQP
jgi:hypothetical protein